MQCSSCGKKINDLEHAAVITFTYNGDRVRRYLCRCTDDLGCAEELLGQELPEVLEAIPSPRTSAEQSVVLHFPSR